LENILKISELEQIDNANKFIVPTMEIRQEQKRINMGTVKQNKRKKLKLKEKVDSRVSVWRQYSYSYQSIVLKNMKKMRGRFTYFEPP
jgi:hypothetical protein